jgi:hypothetical protein
LEITVSVKDPSPEFERDLRALLDKHRAALRYNPGWNKERARVFYAGLPARAQRIILRAVLSDGKVSASDLRDSEDSSLRGHASAFARCIRRGVTEGWWDSGMKSPIVPLGPGSGKVEGYQFRDAETFAVFQDALPGHTPER